MLREKPFDLAKKRIPLYGDVAVQLGLWLSSHFSLSESLFLRTHLCHSFNHHRMRVFPSAWYLVGFVQGAKHGAWYTIGF